MFSFRRVFILIVLGMVIFNIVMMTFTQKFLSTNPLSLIPVILLMSVAGLIITPAPIGLAIYAFSIETLYVKRVFKRYWLFYLISGFIGMAIFISFSMILSGGIKLDIQMLPPLLVSHILTTIAVYRNKFKPYKGENNAKPTLHL